MALRQSPSLRSGSNGCYRVSLSITKHRYKRRNKNKTQSETAGFAPGAATWRTERNIRVVFDSGTFVRLGKNMTSSTKPEVHNILHYRQGRTEPRTRVTRIEISVKLGHAVFEICERTDRQTDRPTDTCWGRELSQTTATLHSYFVLCPDPPTDRGTSPLRWMLDFENFLLCLRPTRSFIPAVTAPLFRLASYRHSGTRTVGGPGSMLKPLNSLQLRHGIHRS